MKQKNSFPKRSGQAFFIFETFYEVELFLCKRAMHFDFQNASHLFLFLWYPLGISWEKKKEKKKGTSLWCFMLGNARGVRCSLELSTHPSWFKWAFFFWRENAWLLQLSGSLIFHQNNSDDEKNFGTNACVMHITYGHVDPLKCVLENMCFIYWVLFGTQRELFGVCWGVGGGGGGGGIRVGHFGSNSWDRNWPIFVWDDAKTRQQMI